MKNFIYPIFLLLTSRVFAEQYIIDWHNISGGGGTSTNGQYSITGAIGQSDAGGTMSGGNYSATGGFWGLISVVQTPGAPALTITHSADSVTISWPSPSDGFTLQQNSNLANTNGWSTYGGTVNTNAAIKSVTITSPTGNQFFRLAQ